MAKPQRSFNVYPRKLKKGTVYYARFRLPNGEFGKTLSTGQATKSRAETWALKYIQENALPVPGDKITLGQFVDGFFDENGPYAERRRALNKRISVTQLRAKEASVVNHILPAIGQDTPLADITDDSVDQLRAFLKKQGKAPSTVNHTLSTLQGIIDAAKRQKIIKYKPDIERVGNRGARTRDTFTVDEHEQLFRLEWEDHRALVGNLLASVTGLRAGEIQGLRVSRLKPGQLEIVEGWNTQTRTLNPTTKTERSRIVPIPEMAEKEIHRLIESNPYHDKLDDPFIFYADKGADHPCEQKVFRDGLYDSLNKIGIDEEERKRRNLVFHSWRHFANSYFINNGASPFQIRSITGHLTEEMQENYYHADEMQKIRELQGNLVRFLLTHK